MRSTASPVSRSPAVSVSSTRTPPICMASVSVSRVVPGISVTIARSPPSSALSRLLLPAFGLPQSTTRNPSSSIRPARASQAASNLAAIALQEAVTSSAVCVSSTSSGKSIAAAIAASRDVISARAVRTNADTPPSICRTALRMARSLPARIIRITPSACARSMRPFMNAR